MMALAKEAGGGGGAKWGCKDSVCVEGGGKRGNCVRPLNSYSCNHGTGHATVFVRKQAAARVVGTATGLLAVTRPCYPLLNRRKRPKREMVLRGHPETQNMLNFYMAARSTFG